MYVLKKINDEKRWITVHPGGRRRDGRGIPVLIESKTGEVLGGMGGRFNGQNISELKQDRDGAPSSSNEINNASAQNGGKKQAEKEVNTKQSNNVGAKRDSEIKNRLKKEEGAKKDRTEPSFNAVEVYKRHSSFKGFYADYQREAKKRLEKVSSGNVNDNQKRVARTYSSTGGCDKINSYLRVGIKGGHDKRLDSNVASLTRAINNNPIKEDTVVFRGVHSVHHSIKNGVYTEPGFSSTSTSINTANKFAGSEGDIIVFSVRKGTHGLAMPSMSYYPEENEILFPPGTTGRVTKQEKINGRMVYFVEMDQK